MFSSSEYTVYDSATNNIVYTVDGVNDKLARLKCSPTHFRPLVCDRVVKSLGIFPSGQTCSLRHFSPSDSERVVQCLSSPSRSFQTYSLRPSDSNSVAKSSGLPRRSKLEHQPFFATFFWIACTSKTLQPTGDVNSAHCTGNFAQTNFESTNDWPVTFHGV